MFDFTKLTQKMVTSADDNLIRIYDITSFELLKEFPYDGSSLEWINYTKFDKWILTASRNQIIIYWAETYQIGVNEQEEHDIVSVDLATNNRFVAYALSN